MGGYRIADFRRSGRTAPVDARGVDGEPPRPTQIVFDGQACSALTCYRLNHTGTRDEVQAFFSPPVDVR